MAELLPFYVLGVVDVLWEPLNPNFYLILAMNTSMSSSPAVVTPTYITMTTAITTIVSTISAAVFRLYTLSFISSVSTSMVTSPAEPYFASVMTLT